MAGALRRIGSEAICSHTSSICCVTLPRNVALRSPLPSSARRIRCTYVPGFVDSAREATEVRPSRSKSSPSPCQITRGSWVWLLVCWGRATERALVASVARRVMERMVLWH